MTITTGLPADTAAFSRRLAIARRIFRGALLFNAALTIFWLVLLVTGRETLFFKTSAIDRATVGRVLGGVFFF